MPVTLEALTKLEVGDAIYIYSAKRTVASKTFLDGQGYLTLETSSAVRMTVLLEPYVARMVTKIIPARKTRKAGKRQPTQYALATTDGGRAAAGFTHETKDCTVRALVEALEVPYATAHDHMKRHGRRDRGASYQTHQAYAAATFGGRRLHRAYESTIDRGPTRTLAAWLKSGNLPKRAILRIRKHVLAVVDGVVRDSFKPGPRSRVLTVWEVIG